MHRNRVDFVEQSFDAQGTLGTVEFSFEITG
jgi:hypothetical protein